MSVWDLTINDVASQIGEYFNNVTVLFEEGEYSYKYISDAYTIRVYPAGYVKVFRNNEYWVTPEKCPFIIISYEDLIKNIDRYTDK